MINMFTLVPYHTAVSTKHMTLLHWVVQTIGDTAFSPSTFKQEIATTGGYRMIVAKTVFFEACEFVRCNHHVLFLMTSSDIHLYIVYSYVK